MKRLFKRVFERRRELSHDDWRFCSRLGIDESPIERMCLEGADLNKAICRSALTGAMLPLDWFKTSEASRIHEQIIARLPALEYFEPSDYGKRAQDGQRGFLMAVKLIDDWDPREHLRDLEETTDLLTFFRFQEKVGREF